MKKITLIFILLANLYSFAQGATKVAVNKKKSNKISSYIPIVKEGNFWDVKACHSADGFCYDQYAYRFEIGAKVAHSNGKEYYGLYQYKISTTFHDDDFPYVFKSFYIEPDVESEFVVFLREDIEERKVYILLNNLSGFEEHLLYDFSLEVGDEIESPFYSVGSVLSYSDLHSSYMYMQIFKVTAIDYTSDGRKIISINYGNDKYTEGIGHTGQGYNTGLLITNQYKLSGSTSENLFCYGNINTKNDCAKILSTEEYNSKKTKIYPNPVKDKLFIEKEDLVSVKLYTSTGSLISEFPQENSIEIDVSNYQRGLYFLEVVYDNGTKETRKIILE